jgi:hypothetical protein
MSFRGLPRGFKLDAFEEPTTKVIRVLFYGLRESIHRDHLLIDRATRLHPPPIPMKRFDIWKEYATAAEEAYGEFLHPVNEAIQKLTSIHPNWAAPLL